MAPTHRALGVERTCVLKKYGCLVELVEERNGWPWERVCVDMDAFQVRGSAGWVGGCDFGMWVWV